MMTEWTDGPLRWTYTTVADLEPIAEMLAKDAVCEHVFFGPNSRTETLEFFEPIVVPMQDALARGERPTDHVFTLRSAADDSFLGQCAAIAVPFAQDHYQIGYQLDEHAWRRGHGTRACRFLISFCFDELAADRVSADCLASNLGSARILEKCGFRAEGHQRRQFYARGRYHDQLLFGLLREER